MTSAQIVFPQILLFFIFIVIQNKPVCGQIKYVGVNLACAEFGSSVPGTFNKHYTYPTHSEVDYFVSKGMNVFRLPFKWERLQISANAEFNSAELSRIKNFVDYAASQAACTILDPHNYARFYGDVIGTEKLPVSVFENFWQKLSSHFKDNPYVIFGLMNEPHEMETELWLADANAAIRAIRATGATNLILVPGNAYTGAHSWNSNWYGTPNGTAMIDIVDPLDNFAFEVHQYLDDNSSGTSESCVNTTIGSARLKNFTDWLRTHNKRGFLGEFGVSSNDKCLAALDDMLKYIDENFDVWLGWSYWAAGPWWGDYMFSIEPMNGQDRLQMAVLEKYISAASITPDHPAIPVEKYRLSQNYPNPFNPITTINYILQKSEKISLKIYNLAGENIETLINGYQIAGQHEIKWKSDGLPSGIYFCQLRAGKFLETKKLILQK
jgi:endoglucanase